MNKKLPIALLGLVVVLGFIVFLVNDKGKSTDSSSSTNSSIESGSSFKTINDACALLTLNDAKQVIGDTAKADTAIAQTADSDDAVVTACTYSTTGTEAIQTASLLVRSPKTTAGASSNLAPFSSVKPTNAQNVENVGESAYWNSELGQLNVLSQGNWLIITAGPTAASNRTQQQAIQAANLILPKI